jgi:hypothetical protein
MAVLPVPHCPSEPVAARTSPLRANETREVESWLAAR